MAERCRSDVYCLSCAEVICQQCGCFSLVHKGHEMQPMDAMHGEHVKTVRREIDRIRGRQKELGQLVADLETNEAEIKKSKENVVQHIRVFVEKLVHGVERERKEKLRQVERQRRIKSFSN